MKELHRERPGEKQRERDRAQKQDRASEQERQRENQRKKRRIFHFLVHFPDDHNDQTGPGRDQEPVASSKFASWMTEAKRLAQFPAAFPLPLTDNQVQSGTAGIGRTIHMGCLC